MYAVRRLLAKCPFPEVVPCRFFKVERQSLIPSAQRRGRWSETSKLSSKNSLKRISDMFSCTQLNLDRYFATKEKPWHACKKIAPCEGLPPKKERGKEARTACCVSGPCKGLDPKAKSGKKKKISNCTRNFSTVIVANRNYCEKSSMTCDDKSFQIVQPKVSSRSVSTATRCSKGCGENYHLFSIRTRGKDKGIMVKRAPSSLESCGGMFLRRNYTTQCTCTRDIYPFLNIWHSPDDLKSTTTQMSPLSSKNVIPSDLNKKMSSKVVKPRNNKSKEVKKSSFVNGGAVTKAGTKKEENVSGKKNNRIVTEKNLHAPNSLLLPPLAHISYIPQTSSSYNKSFLYKKKRSVLP